MSAKGHHTQHFAPVHKIQDKSNRFNIEFISIDNKVRRFRLLIWGRDPLHNF
jgi:hypothetical protein